MLIADQNRLVHIRAPVVTIGLILACCAIFVAQGGEIGPEWLAFVPARIAAAPGDALAWVGVVGHALLHGGLLHLLANMLALWVFGDNVEDAFGHARYLLFLAATAAAGAGAFALAAPPMDGLVGASGAISGVMAAYLLLYPRARVMILAFGSLPLAAPASWVVGIWLMADLVHAVGLVAPAEPEAMPTAWVAHLGGFAAGLVLAPLCRLPDVRLFQPGPCGDTPPGRLMRYAIDLGPPADGNWTAAATVKAALFVLLAGLGLLFAI